MKSFETPEEVIIKVFYNIILEILKSFTDRFKEAK